MPQGLQVWNESGVLILDTSTYTSRVLSDVTYTYEQNTYINLPPLSGTQKPWVIVYNFSNRRVDAQFTDGDTRLFIGTATFGGEAQPPPFSGEYRVVYGVQ